jgi:HK97 family phage major capsid protein
MQQSALAVDAFVREELSKRMAIAIDYNAFNGRGATTYYEPTGILKTTGIGATAWTTASTPTWAKVVELEGEVAQSNALMGNLRYVTSPAFLSTLKTTVKAASYPVYLAEGGMMNGYQVLSTTQMPAATVLFGNFSDVILGFWGGLDLIVDNVSANNGDVTIKVFQDYDVVVRHPASFCLASNTAS